MAFLGLFVLVMIGQLALILTYLFPCILSTVRPNTFNEFRPTRLRHNPLFSRSICVSFGAVRNTAEFQNHYTNAWIVSTCRKGSNAQLEVKA